MRANLKTNLLMLFALAVVAIFINSCRTDDVDAPPLTGPSGQRLFLTIQAEPDHLVIRGPGKNRDKSTIIVQLKNQLGQGVPNETVKLRIANREGSEINIGRLSQLSGVTDAGGFIRVTYSAPNSLEQQVPTRIYILAIMTNPSFTNEVTDIHAIDLEFAQPPIDCVGNGPGAPVPDFTVTTASPAVNEVTCFDAQASTDNGIIVAASWNFGDGSTGAGLNVCHTFTREGRFNVTLTVQDDDHNCATITQVVEVTNAGPTCAFTFSPSDPQIGQNVQFNAAESTDPESNLTSFQWNFGDGGTASGKIANHAFNSEGTFTVTLTVRDNQGETAVCTQTITVGNQPPDCDIVVSPAGTINVNQSVTLDGSGSSDPEGDNLTFKWSIPGASLDSGTLSSPTITVHFETANSFVATLTVTDEHGTSSTCSETITVGTGGLPTCSFTGTPTTNVAPFNVNFNASGSIDSDGTIADFRWNFGDGSAVLDSGTDPTVSHSYTDAGTFTVTLTVTDNDGNSVNCQKSITVGSAPVCNASANPTTACVGETVNFSSNASDPDGGLLTFAWTFGDSGTSTAENPSHSYSTTGSKSVHLTVTDDEGQTCESSTAVTVIDSPTITNFSFSSTCGGAAGTLTLTGTNFTASSTVEVDGAPVVPATITSTTITINNVTFGAGSGQHTAQVSNACGTSNLFNVTNCP